MFDAKVLGIGFVAGFALSFIVGIFSAIPFGALLLRAVLFGALFGALAILARVVVIKFLPEALEASADSASAKEADGDSPESPIQSFVPAGSEAASEVRNLVDIVLPEEGIPVGVEDIEQATEFANEVAEEVKEAGGSAPMTARAERVLTRSPGRESLLDDVDVLPDLDTFSDSFVSPIANEADEGERVLNEHAYSSAPRGAGGPMDDKNPEMLAKAVQTLLRKDQKG